MTHQTWFPAPEEYAPFYAGYVAQVKDKAIIPLLQTQYERIPALFAALNEAQWLYRYAQGKWSVKELLGHLSDAERVFAYRLLRFGRGDATALPGFDENLYVENAQADRLAADYLIADWKAARMNTLSLLYSLSEENATFCGTASGATMSVRALLAVIAGHTEHHLGVLRERYGLEM